jgi:hypothetical protein
MHAPGVTPSFIDPGRGGLEEEAMLSIARRKSAAS